MIKINRPNKKPLCWWCGKPADSREHRHKKSDVKFIFGDKFEGEPVIIKDKSPTTVQGPNSSLLKFDTVLCQVCNNSRSQPFDRAYSRFVDYVIMNYDEILETRNIDFNNIIETDLINFKNDIYRYFTKIFCCRLASNNFSIAREIIEFLNYKKPINFLYFKFEIRPDIYTFLNSPDAKKYEGNIYLSPLRYIQSLESNQIELIYQFYDLQWLRVYTFYSKQMIEDFYSGYTKYNESNILRLEARYSVDPEILYEPRDNEKTVGKDDSEWLDEYLQYEIFKD